MKNKGITDKSVAVIPARGGSKYIPRKNIMDFCGKPLIAWSIEQAQASSCISEVYVTTDDREIEDISVQYGAKVIRRPSELATDITTSEEALLHAIPEIERHKKIDTAVFLQATSPLRENGDIDKAIEKFFSEKADSLFSAAVLNDFCLWEINNGKLKSVTFDYKKRGVRQDRLLYYLENGSIYIFKPKIFKKYKNRLAGKIVYYSMPLWKSYEIDTPQDMEICEYYMQSKILEKKDK